MPKGTVFNEWPLRGLDGRLRCGACHAYLNLVPSVMHEGEALVMELVL